jgi:hypothetical protein
VLGYAEAAAAPERMGGPYDVAVCNFALLDDDPTPLLVAVRARLAPGGSLVIQTVHPWAARGDAPYEDGWRTETFAAFGAGFASPMPWYYRTLSSWVRHLAAAGYRIADLREPLHPETGGPASLVVVGE